ncbi:DUF1835 domain-containing protein [Mucilaginibacter polytrichastri]|uniref:DUF1835 domain-containing protein n=1 Tax=Mucilaginibacter polytrichastri TaxID=1302689 RepID=A0A1Q6A4G4_9SPHI|nr:DUF1835 domain-containing protein [Mucilaginibacter polytrichastri]OKS88892.1 hypothetical protein RG47T_4370 [Mucilaginibacter polytrichastri]SFT25766.1 protein of unknown function [Mucilaginibacter polytrichastri]
MENTLQILNGDDTLKGFNDTGLDGDVIVWREVLSEGPVTKTIDSEFWKMRTEWVSKTFTTTPEHYLEHMVGQLEKFNYPYEEINLWFEFDLHCQVNMLAAMQLIEQQFDLSNRAIYLISPDSYPGLDDFRGMGQLNGEQLEYLFDGRLRLTDYDFRLAEEAWSLYVRGNVNDLQNWIDTNPFWGSLHQLKAAMQAHVKRLTVNADGHNYIEQKLLAIKQSGIVERADIYEQFWSAEKIYGMGDRELDIYLERLDKDF